MKGQVKNPFWSIRKFDDEPNKQERESILHGRKEFVNFDKTLVVLLPLILLPNGRLFINKTYMVEKRTEMRML